MTGFLNAIKEDLLDRRLLPLVVLVAFALLLAVGYLELGGGSSSSTPTGPLSATPAAPAGLTVSRLSPERAVAETTAGVADQRKGAAGDPFLPLPSAETKEKPAAQTASSSSSSVSSGSPSSSGSKGSESSSPSSKSESSPPAPAPPAKPKTVYHVAVLFGVEPPPGTPEGEQKLTPYENLKLLTPLPSAKQALIVFRGVTAKGKSATFTIAGEVILHGKAKCVPSEELCEAIELTPGQSESLEVISASGQPVVYELQLVAISSSKGSNAKVESVLRGASKAGRELLRRDGLTELPGLRYSAQQGVLVPAGH